jgi:hypothetical protein
MKTENLQRFQNELPGWLLRGALCAANSAVWAALIGFQAPAEIAGMLFGVVFWAALFAAACAVVPVSQPWFPEAAAALKWATWIKVGLMAAAWLVYVAASAVHFERLAGLAMFGTLDVLLGLVSLGVVSKVAGLVGPEAVTAANSFGLTALTTVVEGALVGMVVVGLAACVWGAWRLRARYGLHWNFISARPFGRRCV